MPFLDPTYERWLAIAGWSAIVTLWHSTLVALALATWRTWRRAATAPTQYAAGVGAMVVCVALSAATPPLLLTVKANPDGGSSRVAPLSQAPVAPATGSIGVPPAEPVRVNLAQLRSAAPWLGALWILGSALALLRLSGGWLLARRIRLRARPIEGDALGRTLATISAMWRLPSADLLASAHIEAPVVVGHFAPAILVPEPAVRLDAAAMEPLLAHELAHVRRRDYAANVVQSIAEAVLVFSPGVHWIGRRIRDAREYCCDDLVAAQCGPRPYVDALAMLAGLRAAAHARPALSVAGPRLIVRIRRLLQEDTMPPFAAVRVTAIAAVLIVLAVAGRGVVRASAAAVGQPQSRTYSYTTPIDGPVPMGFIATQAGAAVRLRDMTSSEAAYCGVATIENQANVAVTSVRFAAQAMAGGPQGSSLSAVSYVASPRLDVTVAPGATATVGVNLFSLEDLRHTLRTGHPQVMCALMEIRYANGFLWSAPPATAFAPAQVEVARSLVGAPAPVPGAPICHDQNRQAYSEGIVLPIALEPGTFARCHDGAWSQYELPGMQPDPAR
jgi:beta-lactamase regulating signal transducer with metallopeptidase domain